MKYYAQAWSDDTQSVFNENNVFVGRFVADLDADNGIRWSGQIGPDGLFYAEPTAVDVQDDCTLPEGVTL